jgi:hypothetical protein
MSYCRVSKVAETVPKVNHLLFTDDCILFGKATLAEAGKIKEVLLIYCNVLGQRLNLAYLFWQEMCRECEGEYKGYLGGDKYL